METLVIEDERADACKPLPLWEVELMETPWLARVRSTIAPRPLPLWEVELMETRPGFPKACHQALETASLMGSGINGNHSEQPSKLIAFRTASLMGSGINGNFKEF